MFGSVLEGFQQKCARLKERVSTLGVVTDGLVALLRLLDEQIEAVTRQRDLPLLPKDEVPPTED